MASASPILAVRAPVVGTPFDPWLEAFQCVACQSASPQPSGREMSISGRNSRVAPEEPPHRKSSASVRKLHPDTTSDEVSAWRWWDFASSGWVQVALVGFFPLLLQQAALESSGFPDVCPNQIGNASEISSVFLNSTAGGASDLPDFMYFTSDPISTPDCGRDEDPACVGNYCRGKVPLAEQCRAADGEGRYRLRSGGGDGGGGIDPTAYATIFISVSVAIQAVMFLTLGAVGDYNNLRRTCMLAATLIGGIASIAGIFVVADTWWLGGPLLLVSNAAFGAGMMMYNAYIGVLVKASPDLRDAEFAAATHQPLPPKSVEAFLLGCKEEDRNRLTSVAGFTVRATSGGYLLRERTFDRDDEASQAADVGSPGGSQNGSPAASPRQSKSYTNERLVLPPSDPDKEHAEVLQDLSRVSPKWPANDKSLALYAYELWLSDELSVSGFICGQAAGTLSIVVIVPAAFFLGALTSYRVATLVGGVWWIVFSALPFLRLRPRPGPPLPPGIGYVQQSCVELKQTFRVLCALPHTGRYMIAWFLTSDGVFAISSLAGLFANSFVDWGCIPQGIGITALFLIVPLLSIAGAQLSLYVSQSCGTSPRLHLIISIVVVMMLAAWGAIGLFPGTTVGLKQGVELIGIAVVLGLAIGPFIAHSRSIMANLIPVGYEAALMGIYEVSDKGSSFIGPLVFSALQTTTGQPRWIVVYNIIMLALGLCVLATVDLQQGKADCAAFAMEEEKALEEGGEEDGASRKKAAVVSSAHTVGDSAPSSRTIDVSMTRSEAVRTDATAVGV